MANNVHPVFQQIFDDFMPPKAEPLCEDCNDTGEGKERDDGSTPSCSYCALGAQRDYEYQSFWLKADFVEGRIRMGAVDNRKAR